MKTLKEELKSQGRSFRWLATKISRTEQTIKQWRQSKTPCPEVYKEKICSLLGVEELEIKDNN
jgi:ribosome-binding protein aMBF1 (putative translation factor)